jgi:hypothetical protein
VGIGEVNVVIRGASERLKLLALFTLLEERVGKRRNPSMSTALAHLATKSRWIKYSEWDASVRSITRTVRIILRFPAGERRRLELVRELERSPANLREIIGGILQKEALR